ncbi:MAG TPA: NADH-quinone oxidoreductase subunit M [Acidimicrobiales bacterium]|jgi:NADH-quinone oxidoreductase subunit M|nr:NADH-quinone oxidoreductase subunit M [Acidimicrobiales bacterium]
MNNNEFLTDWGLTLMVFLPLAGALVMLLIPKAEEQMHKWLALLVSLAAAGVGVALLADFDYDQTDRLQFVQDQSWIDVIHSRYLVGIDGLSVPLVALTLLIVPLCIIYSWNHFPEPRNPKAFLILLLVLHTGMLGTFVAQDLILFFVFFEIVLLPMYFLIGVWGGEQRQYAAIKFFLFTLFGSALMIVSFLALFFVADGETFVMADLARGVAESDMSRLTGLLIFGGMFMGFGIKVPMFPFHTWLPDAHTEAPTVGSVILAAILLKLGTYGFVRVALPILPEAAVEWAPYIGALAVVGIIYGALACLAQTDMKRLIAFSSVSHMGFTMLGIATLTDFGLNAAVMGMVAHGLITGMLFFLAGSVKERYHTLDIKRLGGILVKAPRMGWVLGFTAMASLGLPGLAGFWGEFPAILSTYQPGAGLSEELFRVYMVVAAVGTVFAAGYLLWLYQRTAFGTPTDEFTDDDIADVTVPEWIAWTPMLVLILAIGVYPNLVFRVTDGQLTSVAQMVASAVGG